MLMKKTTQKAVSDPAFLKLSRCAPRQPGPAESHQRLGFLTDRVRSLVPAEMVVRGQGLDKSCAPVEGTHFAVIANICNNDKRNNGGRRRRRTGPNKNRRRSTPCFSELPGRKRYLQL